MGAAERLAACWRKDEAHDPLAFGLAVSSVFTLYAPDVVQFVCDPRTGLPKTHRWPPTISEVHEACSERIADLERKKRFENWGHNDPEQRERLKDQGRLAAPVEIKPTLEELKERFGPNWGLGDTSMRAAIGIAPARPVTKERVFMDKVRAETVARHRVAAEQTSREYFRRGGDCPTQPDAPIILDVNGNPVDQGADF
jgi:hypothetical protein